MLEAEMFSVACELVNTTKREAEWREVIRQIREVYSGELVDSANWDDEKKVPFWDALDYIGVDAYYGSLIESNNPSLDELYHAWDPIVDMLRGLHEKY